MAFNINQPRDARGRFVSTGVTSDHIVRVIKSKANITRDHVVHVVDTTKLTDLGITDAHRIAVKSSRVRKYKGHETVGSYVKAHPKGRAAALRTLAADHKAGRIEFAESVTEAVKVPSIAHAADVSFGSDVSPEFTGTVSKAYAKLPGGVKQQLKRAGITVRAPKRLADIMDTSQTPRGWPAGTTWDSADGVYRGGDVKQVVVTQTAKSRYTGNFYNSNRTSGVLYHETGHGLDDSFYGSVSATRTYRDAYDADVSDYLASGGSKSDDRYAYFLQEGSAGPSEMFAEHFAELHGETITNSVPSLTERFPRSAAVLRDTVDRLGK